ncbi:MAG: ATP-binding protein [Actinomycetota bacterium]
MLFVILAIGSVAIAVSSRRVVDDQEQRLLEQRAAEVGALFSLSGARLQEALRAASTVVEVTKGDLESFAAAAQTGVDGRLFGAVALVESDGAGYRILRGVGSGLATGQSLSEPVVGTLRRAGATFVTTPVFSTDGQRHIGYALAVPNRTPPTFIYAESVLSTTTVGTNRQNSLFNDLDGAVYVGERADREQLVLATSGFRLGSGAVDRTFRLGADPWTVEVSPRRSLVGSLAVRQPWLYLIGGLIAAVLVAALVEVLLRRRRFALTLVDQRTAELRRSLAELDAAQHRLVEQERLAAIGQLASAVGHELRNPLGVLSNVFYLLGQRLGRDDPWLDRQLATGEREVGAATLIVSDLLEFSRPRQPVFDSVEVAGLVEEVLSVAPPPTGVEVARRLPAGLPPMRADRHQIRQVLLNLVGNAYDAMADGGLLIIEGDPAGDTVRLIVSDTGGGIPPEALPRLFEPFFTTKAKGIGLGLAVAQRIVDAHGGSLEASTTSTGAKFELALPAAVVPAGANR